jgi:hypothetical protein
MEGGCGKKNKKGLSFAERTPHEGLSFLFFSSPSKVFLESREGSRKGIPFSLSLAFHA